MKVNCKYCKKRLNEQYMNIHKNRKYHKRNAYFYKYYRELDMRLQLIKDQLESGKISVDEYNEMEYVRK